MTPNPVTDAKADLASILGPAVAPVSAVAIDFVPEELPAPCVVIDGADPYIEQGDTYAPGEFWLTCRLFALVDVDSNHQAVQDLDALVCALLPALAGPAVAAGWEFGPVGRPEPFRAATWVAQGVAITVRTLITIDTQENP